MQAWCLDTRSQTKTATQSSWRLVSQDRQTLDNWVKCGKSYGVCGAHDCLKEVLSLDGAKKGRGRAYWGESSTWAKASWLSPGRKWNWWDWRSTMAEKRETKPEMCLWVSGREAHCLFPTERGETKGTVYREPPVNLHSVQCYNNSYDKTKSNENSPHSTSL